MWLLNRLQSLPKGFDPSADFYLAQPVKQRRRLAEAKKICDQEVKEKQIFILPKPRFLMLVHSIQLYTLS